MKTIKLSKTKIVFIDDEDFSLVSNYKWSYNKAGKSGYAMANGKMENYKFPNGKTITMHRLILGAKNGQEVDHKNGNGLDNRRENLRICSRAENGWNKGKTKIGASSKYKGVCFLKREKKWLMQIAVKGKNFSARFKDELDAAKEYNKFAKKYHGDFARLNQIKVNNS